MDVKSHLNFKKESQLVEVTLEKVSTLPTGWAAGLIYLTAENGGIPANTVCYYNGTAWIPIINAIALISEVNAGGGIVVSVDGTTRKVTVDPDNTTLELSDGTDTSKVRIKARGVAFSHMPEAATMKVIGRIGTGNGDYSAIDILTSLTPELSADQQKSLASAQSIKDYVAASITAVGSLQGGWDATAQSVFPTRTVTAETRKGDYWYVTVAGTIHGVPFNVGDVMIANVDGATIDNTDPDDYTFLETNRDQATEEVLGLAKIATNLQVSTGTDDTTIITPLKLKTLLTANETYTRFHALVAAGDTPRVVTHSLGTKDLLVEVYKNPTTTFEKVLVDISFPTVDTVSLNFAENTTESYKVVLHR